MNLKVLFIYLLCIKVICLFGQQTEEVRKNLVPNGSFENYRKKSGSIRQAIPWTQIASVDYYQEPLIDDTSSQKNTRNLHKLN